MKHLILCVWCCIYSIAPSSGQDDQAVKAQPLFTANLSNAEYNKNVWSVDKQGVLSATADEMIWTTREYENFELTLEFKNEDCTNSGVIIYCSDKPNWIPHAIEIQIADDYCAGWTDWHPTWLCGAVFGHLAPSQQKLVKKPGQWNTMKITAIGKNVAVALNGTNVINMDLNLWTSGKTNPDGSEIPSWMPTPFAELKTKGYIGFQGKHGEATIYFRNIEIKELPNTPDPETVYVVKKTDDFKVTGDGSSQHWEKAAWLPLTQRRPTEADPSRATKIKMLYSPTGVYCLYDCPDKKITSTMEADFLDLWKEDVVEVFFWTDEALPAYFEYEISPLNYELPILISNYDGDLTRWQPFHYDLDRLTQHAVTVRGGEQQPQASITGWTAEFFIPYNLLRPLNNIFPKSGSQWRANFYRIDYDDGAIKTWSWQLTERNFHDYKRFGTLLFE